MHIQIFFSETVTKNDWIATQPTGTAKIGKISKVIQNMITIKHHKHLNNEFIITKCTGCPLTTKIDKCNLICTIYIASDSTFKYNVATRKSVTTQHLMTQD